MKKQIASFAVPAAFMAVMIFGNSLGAATIGVTYTLTGTANVVGGTGTTLTLDALATGSVLSASAAVNALWNPVAYSDEGILNLTTGLLNGTFTFTFAEGAQLFGTLFEDDTAVLQSPTQTGPFIQALTFTGGT